MSIDTVKNFWNSRPCNIRHSTREVGTKEYFDDVQRRKYFVEPHIPEFAQFDLWWDEKVLELGAGLGTDSINFARNHAKLTCIELSEKSIELCKKRFEVYKLKANFYLGNAEQLSEIVPIEEYDLIYSFGVIHHTPNPEKVLSEMKYYMGEKTEARIMLYSKYSWKAFENFIRSGWRFGFNFKKTIQYFAEAQSGCPVAYTYSARELKELLKDFEIVSMNKAHIFPYKVKDYVNYVYKKRFIFRIMPKRFFSWLESVLGWHWLITFKLK